MKSRDNFITKNFLLILFVVESNKTIKGIGIKLDIILISNLVYVREYI